MRSHSGRPVIVKAGFAAKCCEREHINQQRFEPFTVDQQLRGKLSTILLNTDRDPETRVAIIRGEGRGFSADGDLGLVKEMANDFNGLLLCGIAKAKYYIFAV